MSDNRKTAYDFGKALMERASQYGVSNEDVETLSMSHLIIDGLVDLHKQFMYSSWVGSRERFPVTAKLETSLMRHGSFRSMSFESITATPSSMDFVMQFNLDKLIDISVDDGNKYKYVIDKGSVMNVGDFNYALDYDIEISITKQTLVDDMAYTAKYIVNDSNPISTDKNPHIQIFKSVVNGVDQLGMVISLKQYMRKTVEYRYVSDEDSVTIDHTFDDQLVDFSVVYKDTPDSDGIQLVKKLDYEPSDPTPTIFFTVTGNTIRLINKLAMGNLIPSRNSIFEITTYTSKGAAAIFEYVSDDIKFNNISEPPIGAQVSAISSSVGGKDKPTVDEFRKMITDKASTRGAYITEPDLNTLLSSSGTSSKIRKSRDDVFRITDNFVLLRDTSGNLIPTNTIDAEFKISEMRKYEDKFICIPDELPIKHNTYSKGIMTTDDSLDGIKLISPYKLTYDNVANIMRVYDKYINRQYDTEYMYINGELPYTFMCKNVATTKENGSNYKIRFEVRTNLSEPLEGLHTIDPDGTIHDTGEMKHICIFKFDGSYIAYAVATMVGYVAEGDYYIYEVDLQSNENYDIYDELVSMNLIPYDADRGLIRDAEVASDIRVSIDTHMEMVSYSKTTGVSDGPSGLPSYDNYSVASTHNCDDLVLYENYSGYQKFDTWHRNSNEVIIYDLPAVGSEYYNNNPKHVYDTIAFFMDTLKSRYSLTEQNTTIRILFSNSYGIPYKFRIGHDNANLDRVDLALSFKAKFTHNHTTTVDDIRSSIVGFINGDSLEREMFHMSNVVDYVMDLYDDLLWLEPVGINGYGRDKHVINSTINDDTLVPEFLNVRLKYNVDKTFSYDINIEKVT